MNHCEGVGGVLPDIRIVPKKIDFPLIKGFDKIF